MRYIHSRAICIHAFFITYTILNLAKTCEQQKQPSSRLKKLPSGVQDIKKILKKDSVYVDKTGYALQLIQQGRSATITRPKGFGKTLFLSTLEEIFLGNKKLFYGTEIYQSDYQWPKYTVFRVDFSQMDHSVENGFEIGLKGELIKFAGSHGIVSNESWILGELINLMENVSLATGTEVVVLVDEYDAPITNMVQDPHEVRLLNIAEMNRQVVAFFLKFVTRSVYNPNVKFAFVAGVNKFSYPGGEPHHLMNIEMDPMYATMMGFTEDEMKTYFGNHIRSIAAARNVSEDDILNEMRLWYGGYRFSEKEVAVYNPESTLRYLKAGKAENFWYASREQSSLIDEAARDNMPLGLKDTTVGLRLNSDDFRIDYLRLIDVRTLMYHAGYLTIRKHLPEHNWYDLDFPNKEARDAYNNSYLLRD